MQKYRVFIKSFVSLMIIAMIYLSLTSLAQFHLTEEIIPLFTQFSISDFNHFLSKFLSHFSLLHWINTLFITSLLFLCIYGFKWILDQGAFYTFEYSWQKTKRYVFFFFPKYWPSRKQIDKNNDYDQETGEKIYHDFQEFYDYKQSKKWEDIHQLLASTIVMVILTLLSSFIII